ncbi:MAG: hypothetical protein ACE3L7_19275 [Candidatus Pristimantibacillus sp.]
MKTTKSKKKSSIIATSAVLLSIMLTASACGANNVQTPNQSNQDSAVEQPGTATATPDPGTVDGDNSNNNGGNNDVSEPDKGSPDTSTGAEEKVIESPVKKAEGVYGGQIDNHSIEVVSDNGPMVLQITDEFSDAVSKLSPDAKIKFEYTEKNIGDQTQFWLKKLE